MYYNLLIHFLIAIWIISRSFPFSPIRQTYAVSLLSYLHFGTEPRTQVLQERGDSAVWTWRNPSPASPPPAGTPEVGPYCPSPSCMGKNALKVTFQQMNEVTLGSKSSNLCVILWANYLTFLFLSFIIYKMRGWNRRVLMSLPTVIVTQYFCWNIDLSYVTQII